MSAVPTNEDKTADLFAFRYALGRTSPAVPFMVTRLKARWQHYGEGMRRQIQEDINGAIKHGGAGEGAYAALWSELLDLPASDTAPSGADALDAGEGSAPEEPQAPRL